MVENIHYRFVILHGIDEVGGVEFGALFQRADNYALFTRFETLVGVIRFEVLFEGVEIRRTEPRVENAHVEISLRRVFFFGRGFLSAAGGNAESGDCGERRRYDRSEFFHHFYSAPVLFSLFKGIAFLRFATDENGRVDSDAASDKI